MQSTRSVDSAPSKSELELLDFWHQTRLSARSREVREQQFLSHLAKTAENPLFKVLTHALAFLSREGAQVRFKRSVPSAGCLYPVEVVGHCRSAGLTFRIDPTNGAVQRLPSSIASDLERQLGSMGESSATVRLAIMARPAKSIRKYGHRGYWYSLLDAGHVVGNVALLSGLCGLRSSVRLVTHGSGRGFKSGDWLEPIATIDLNATQKNVAHLRDYLEGQPEHDWQPEAGEQKLWLETQQRIHLRGECVSEAEARLKPFLSFDPPALVDGGVASSFGEFYRLLQARASEKKFARVPVGLSEIAGLLRRVESQVMVRAVKNCAKNLGQTVIQNVTLANVQSSVFNGVGTGEDFVAACMAQELAESATAMIVLHQKRPSSGAEFRSLCVLSAMIAQNYYLAAAKDGVGITCIGAFDDSKIRQMADLDDTEEVINVLLIGASSNVKASKLDQDAFAYSHGSFESH